MPDIFLSYNREDHATARRFAEGFEREGLSVWWDAALRSGEAYDEVTEQALREAKAVVVLWSKKSVVSRWVRAEATLADRNKTLVPAMIEECQRPIMFELTQTADLSAWSGDTSASAWQAYLADVRQFVRKDSLGVGIAAEVARSAPRVADASGAEDLAVDRLPSIALVGETVSLADGVLGVSASTTGVVAYRVNGGGQRQLTWVDRSGAVLGSVGPRDGSLLAPRPSTLQAGPSMAAICCISASTQLRASTCGPCQ